MTTYPKSVISDGEIQVTQLRYTFKTPFHLSVLGPERDHAYQWMDTSKTLAMLGYAFL
jgi:hypothetical protein